MNDRIVRAIGTLVSDGVPSRELDDHLWNLMSALDDEREFRILWENRPLPAASENARRCFPLRVRAFAEEFTGILKGYECADDVYLTLDPDWVKEGDIPPVPDGMRWSLRVRVNDVPKLLNAVADFLPHGAATGGTAHGGSDGVELAEHELVAFVRETSNSRTPHFRELSDLISTLVPRWFGHRYKPQREFHEDAMSQRDYRRRKQVEEEAARLAARVPTRAEMEIRQQLTNALARMKLKK